MPSLTSPHPVEVVPRPNWCIIRCWGKSAVDTNKLNNSVAQEPEGSSPHTQQLATGPYPDPVESSPHPPANLPKIHSDPILPSTPWSSKWSLSFRLSHQNLLHFSLISLACHMPCPPHPPWLDPPNDIWEWVQTMKFLIVQLYPFSSHHPSFVKIFPLVPCSQTPVYVLLLVWDQVSHPYKTTGRIMVLYVLTFTFLDSRRDDKRLWTEGQQ
jgi:hypothetical protein